MCCIPFVIHIPFVLWCRLLLQVQNKKNLPLMHAEQKKSHKIAIFCIYLFSQIQARNSIYTYFPQLIPYCLSLWGFEHFLGTVCLCLWCYDVSASCTMITIRLKCDACVEHITVDLPAWNMTHMQCKTFPSWLPQLQQLLKENEGYQHIGSYKW